MSSDPRWQVRHTEQTEMPHVVPIDDLREHEPAYCWCSPTLDDGVMVHHAMDKREEYERGRMPS
jgi:hypothetical protein